MVSECGHDSLSVYMWMSWLVYQTILKTTPQQLCKSCSRLKKLQRHKRKIWDSGSGEENYRSTLWWTHSTPQLDEPRALNREVRKNIQIYTFTFKFKHSLKHFSLNLTESQTAHQLVLSSSLISCFDLIKSEHFGVITLAFLCCRLNVDQELMTHWRHFPTEQTNNWLPWFLSLFKPWPYPSLNTRTCVWLIWTYVVLDIRFLTFTTY